MTEDSEVTVMALLYFKFVQMTEGSEVTVKTRLYFKFIQISVWVVHF
jgi:hypothetical protein